MKPYLSIVIPAYNEETNFRAGVLNSSIKYLLKQKFLWEIIFVDDESTDQTNQLISRFCKNHKNCRLLSIPHGGRAAAMRKGILAAEGKYILYTDFDQSTSMSEVEKFLVSIKKFSIVIGSRGHGKTVRYDSYFNKIRAKIFAGISRLVFLPGIVDTSCGFKLYQRSVARRIFNSLKASFPKNLKDAYMGAVDTEILFLARKYGYTIDQIPVNWYRKPATRLHMVKEVSRILRDLALIKVYDLMGKYENQAK